MLPDRVSNPGPLTYESGALPIALRSPAPYLEVPSYLKLRDLQSNLTSYPQNQHGNKHTQKTDELMKGKYFKPNERRSLSNRNCCVVVLRPR